MILSTKKGSRIFFKYLQSIGGSGGNGNAAKGFCSTDGGSGGLAIGTDSVANGGNAGQDFGNGGNGGIALNGGSANTQDGTNSENVGNGGFAIGDGSEANGANGQNGGVAVGAGSDANGRLNGGQDHAGCNVAIGSHCFNVIGRKCWLTVWPHSVILM